MLLDIPESLAEPLEVDDLPLSQEADGIADLRVFYHPQDVVVGGAGFLLCCQILKKVCDGISFGLKFAGVKRNAASSLRPDTSGMVNVIGTKARLFDFFRG